MRVNPAYGGWTISPRLALTIAGCSIPQSTLREKGNNPPTPLGLHIAILVEMVKSGYVRSCNSCSPVHDSCELGHWEGINMYSSFPLPIYRNPLRALLVLFVAYTFLPDPLHLLLLSLLVFLPHDVQYDLKVGDVAVGRNRLRNCWWV